MNQSIRLSKAIKILIIICALLLFAAVWPGEFIQQKYVSKSNEIIAMESDPVSVEHNITQMFVGEGGELSAVDLYVCNDMRGETITFRLYDSGYNEIFNTFYVVKEKQNLPGFVHIPVGYDLERDMEYYFTIEGLSADMTVAYEDRETSTAIVNGFMSYGGVEIQRYNVIIRYEYSNPFVWWQILIAGITIAAAASALVWGVSRLFEKKLTDRDVKVHTVFKAVLNPLIIFAGLLLCLMIFPGRRFGTGALNYAFYGGSILLLMVLSLVLVNAKRIGNEPLINVAKIKEQWAEYLMSVCLAVVFWYCYKYMNGLYEIHHEYAQTRLIIWFILGLLCTFLKKSWRPKKIVVPYAMFFALLLALMIVFRNGRTWGITMTLLFVLFYIRMWAWDGSKNILRILADGLTLNFIYMVIYSLMHRPYHRYYYYRYGLGYHTVTTTAIYLSLIVSVLMVKAFLKYRRTRSIICSWPELVLLGVGNAYMLITLSRNGYLTVGITAVFLMIFLMCLAEKGKWKVLCSYVGMLVISFAVMFPIVFTLTRIMPALNNDPILSEIEMTGHHIDKGEPTDSRLYMDIEHFYNVGIYKVLGINKAGFAMSDKEASEEIKWQDMKGLAKAILNCNHIYIVNDEIVLASNDSDVVVDNSLNEISNGRIEIFKTYIDNWNMTGHENMEVETSDGEVFVHAHNVYLQVIHDHGLVTGIVFILFGIVSFILLMIRFVKTQNTDFIYAIAIVLAFAVSGVAEWNFHLCNAFGISVFIVVTPLLFRDKEVRVNEKQ